MFMVTKKRLPLLIFLLIVVLILPVSALAESNGQQNLRKAEQNVDQALQAARQGDLAKAHKYYQQFHDGWGGYEDTVKTDSGQAYSDIESNMGQAEYAFIKNKQQDIVKALQGLQSVDGSFLHGKYAKGEGFKQQNITLSDFLMMLQETKEKVQSQEQKSALSAIAKVRESWLSVEGNVVAKSATVYNDSERDMVIVNAMISSGNYQGAGQLLDKMIRYLTPLSGNTGYTLWDAAMIPIREGLEALLVVGALLAFVKKSNEGKGKGWIWSGVLAGLPLSAILAVVVKFVFSSGAFGQNNFLISGWTGVIAAAMLFYMSYWLHSKSNIAEWNQYIHTKSQTAVDMGRIISLGFLSFLAVFREGTETVLFLIGMVNQISVQQLLLGILTGFGILAVIAYLMLAVGMKLPMRPFFLVSSFIVFYLCIKFTGLGIHSLQLAGTLPSTMSANLPSIDFLGFYPSWQSAIPQIILLVFALLVFLSKRINTNREQLKQSTIQDL